jgi:hypothetical protein
LLAVKPEKTVFERLQALVHDLERLLDFAVEFEQILDLPGKRPQAA